MARVDPVERQTKKPLKNLLSVGFLNYIFLVTSANLCVKENEASAAVFGEALGNHGNICHCQHCGLSGTNYSSKPSTHMKRWECEKSTYFYPATN